MPAQNTLVRQHDKSHRVDCTAILLTMAVLFSCDARAEIPVNNRAAMEPAESAAPARPVINAGATATIRPQVGPQPALTEGALRPLSSRILKEVGKQTVDQPGHFLIAAAPIWASRYLVGVPWYGWAIAPLLAYREWLQWPSNRWWDPPLDWIFLSLGAVVATCRRRPERRVPDGLPSLRRSIAKLSSLRAARRGQRVAGAGPPRRSTSPCNAPKSPAQCSKSRSRIPTMTSRIPITSVRLGHSWNSKIEAAKVNTSSIWPRART